MLKASQPSKDLGTVKFGKQIGFGYEVENVGPDPLEITKIGVGCTSCTKASIDKTRLGVGDKAIIYAIFTPGSIGAQKKYINVYWDVVNVLRLEFTANSHA